MAQSPKSIRPAPIVEEAVANNGGGRGLSHRLAQISDRYLEILRRSPLPDLSPAEWSAVRDAMLSTLHEPAAIIRGEPWIAIEDSLPDGLAEKWEIDGAALVAKLRDLTYPQEVRLVELIERQAADVSTSGKLVRARALADDMGPRRKPSDDDGWA